MSALENQIAEGARHVATLLNESSRLLLEIHALQEELSVQGDVPAEDEMPPVEGWESADTADLAPELWRRVGAGRGS